MIRKKVKIVEGVRLILNDGTIIEGGRAGLSLGNLWCFFTGYNLQQATKIFFNPGKTSRIVFQYGEMEDVHEGYTNCTSASIDADGLVTICMEKG